MSERHYRRVIVRTVAYHSGANWVNWAMELEGVQQTNPQQFTVTLDVCFHHSVPEDARFYLLHMMMEHEAKALIPRSYGAAKIVNGTFALRQTREIIEKVSRRGDKNIGMYCHLLIDPKFLDDTLDPGR